MSTTNGMWLHGRLGLHRFSLRILEYLKGVWLGLEARPDFT